MTVQRLLALCFMVAEASRWYILAAVAQKTYQVIEMVINISKFPHVISLVDDLVK